jgi:prophage antirepressor-like protein
VCLAHSLPRDIIPGDELSNTVRVVEIDDQPWFVAADVCRVLDLEHVSNALKPLADDQKTRKQITGMRGPAALLISESGLYKLVMRSDKPEARQFQDWVTREVLPAIRKDGMYVAPVRRR